MNDRITPGEAEALLPLKPAVFSILLALAEEGACHGYGIKKRVEQSSKGRVRLDPGTLYRWMARLLEDGWVAEDNRRPLPDEDERRKYYRLTSRGRQMLKLESRRLADLVETARRMDLVPEP